MKIAGRWLVIAGFVVGCASPPVSAVEPELQPIYTNTSGGTLCGTSVATPCKVPAGKRLVIEYVSGYAFQALSPQTTIAVSMVVTSAPLGLNGNSFHTFVAQKTNTTIQQDVFAFSAPLRMMLPPQASFYFAPIAGLGVSGYLVNAP